MGVTRQQTCLPQNTSVSTPNTLCLYFQISDQIFCRCTTNQSIQNSVKGQFFYHSSCKNSVWTYIFKLYGRTTLGRLYFDYIWESHAWLKTAEHFLQKQCTMCAAFADASFLERLLSGRSLFPWFWNILPPLRRSHATTYHRQLRIQTHHIGRWPTSIEFRCKVDIHWLKKLFWPIRTGCILQSRKWLEIWTRQLTITPHQRSMIGFAGNQLSFVHVAISVLSWHCVHRTASRFPY